MRQFVKNSFLSFFFFLVSGKYLIDKKENCLRLFALQSVGADAMRKVFVNPADFEAKKNNFKKSCSKKNEMILKSLSGKYENFKLISLLMINIYHLNRGRLIKNTCWIPNKF